MEAIRALSLYRRRKFDEAMEFCDEIMKKKPLDKAMWYIKCRSLIQKDWIDDTDIEEEGVAELILGDGSAIAENSKPGTSLGRNKQQLHPSNKPSTKSGKFRTGFVRPSTSNQNDSNKIEDHIKSDRGSTARPFTQSGRFVRLGTTSLASAPGGPFIQIEQMDLKKYGTEKDRIPLGKALCDYLLYVLHDPHRAFKLCSYGTENEKYQDWWWQNRIGKAYYQMGLYRDAERQYRASLRNQDMIVTYLELCKVFIKIDQPITAIDIYSKGSHNHPSDTHLILGKARVYELLGDLEKNVTFYEKVLELDASNVESIACLGSNAFYEDQPEISLRLYRRLLQMGVNNSEIWNNLGLCCFYASQYDMTLSCFEKALLLADDSNMSDIWYNIGHVGIGLGDIALAFECFKIAVNIDPNHSESLNCLGVIELRKGNLGKAKIFFEQAKKVGGKMYEPIFNLALVNFHYGELKTCFDNLQEVLKIFPYHHEANELIRELKKQFK